MFRLFKHKPAAPPSPPDDRSSYEKLGIELRAAPVTDAPGRDWAWVLGQFEGREYWGNAARVRVRRKAWPVAIVRKGLRLPASDGDTVVDPDYSNVWHVWRENDVGDQSTFIGGLCQGFGGSLGADHDDDDFVMVRGKREHDGTMYRPSAEDLAATDWELYAP